MKKFDMIKTLKISDLKPEESGLIPSFKDSNRHNKKFNLLEIFNTEEDGVFLIILSLESRGVIILRSFLILKKEDNGPCKASWQIKISKENIFELGWPNSIKPEICVEMFKSFLITLV